MGVLFVISTLRGTFNHIPDLTLFRQTASCFLLDIPYFALALDNVQSFLGQDLSATEHLRLACQAFNINDSKDDLLISVTGILGNISHTQCPIDSAPIPTPILTPDLDGTPTLSAAPLSVGPLVQVSIMAASTPTPTPVATPAVTSSPVPSMPVNIVNETDTEAKGSASNIRSPLPADILEMQSVTLPDWVDQRVAMVLVFCFIIGAGWQELKGHIPMKSRSELEAELKAVRQEIEQQKLTKMIAVSFSDMDGIEN